MPTDGFTIRIYVPDGDPDGVRFIDRMASTGRAISFPRAQWPRIRSRPEFKRAGVYILSGYAAEEPELPTLYIGQGDGVLDRINSHFDKKDFWDWGFAFVTKDSDSGFNRAHITWLEHMLITRALRAGRSRLDNSVTPSEPTLSEADKADTSLFLREILQVLPLVGLRAFEVPVPVATPSMVPTDLPTTLPTLLGTADGPDTVIVPAQKEGFDRVFLGQHVWWSIRIGGGMLPRIKYIAAYQSQPVSAITHVAPVASIEPYGEDGKFKLIFAEPAKQIEPIPFANAPAGSMQGPRYTTYARLMAANKIADLFPTT
jgi:hypothetical protein